MFGLGLGRMGLVGDLGFAIRRSLFGRGIQGLWYDLNDDATIFQDSAGTTLATWGDPVGLTLDKSRWDGRGVVNRLLRTQEFDNASWQKTNASVTANTEVAPDGTTTADTLTDDATSGPHRASQTITASTSERVFSVFAKKGTSDFVQLLVSNGSANWITVIANLDTGTIMQTGVGSTGSITSSEVTLATAGWYRIRMVGTVAGADSFRVCTVPAESGNTLSTGGSVIYSGSGSTIHVWGAQLELGSTATAYQANGASVGGAGNHSIQSTAGSRPIRGRMPKRGRVNLVAPSENFADASWTKTNCSITSGVVTTSATSDGLSRALTNYNANTSHAWTFRVSTGTATWLRFVCFHTTATANRVSGWFNIAGGVVGSATNGGTGTGAAISAVEVSAGVYDVTLTGAVNNSAANVTIQISTATADLSTTGVSGVTYTPVRTQLEAGTATAYQHVIDSLGFNVTETGQPSCGYLSYNGSNQWMQTAAAVDFSATDEMSVFAGVRKVSDAASATVAELSVSTLSNAGSFWMGAPYDATFEFGGFSRGSAAATNSIARIDSATYAAPTFRVISQLMEISADTHLLRLDGTQVASSTGDQGSGNYGNYVAYFGSRAGANTFLNGLMFSTIIRGALTSGTLLTRTEQYVARQTPTVNL